MDYIGDFYSFFFKGDPRSLDYSSCESAIAAQERKEGQRLPICFEP